MWKILQHDEADDFVIATGEMHSVRSFVEKAFACVDIEIEWQGQDIGEKGIDKKTGKTLVAVDPKFFRPTEVEQLLGDPTKAKTLLDWNPRQTSFDALVKEMVESDMKLIENESF
jgi:GDPmannose 4,6-dehydratase